jgi:hypothetical protein
MAIAHTLPPLAARQRAERRTWAAAIGLVAIGAVLRLLGARGELCLDEIWTLNQIAPVTDIGQILVHLSNDNNHVLNSIYVWAVGGAERSPLVLRALSIALGTASIAAAGLVASARGRSAALIAMLGFAASYPLVHYGSEARGYAGLVLFALLAIACLQRQFVAPEPRTREALGLAIGLGLFAHLNMAAAATMLALWTAWVIWRRTGEARQAAQTTLAIFTPALAWTLVVGTCIALGWYLHSFQVGNFPFAPETFIAGYGLLLRLAAGLPEQVPAWLCVACAVGAVAGAAWLRRNDDDPMMSLYVGAVILLPAAMFVARLPNTEFPRHFMFSAVVFLLFAADLLSRAWQRRGGYRAMAIALLVAFVAGNAVSISRFLENGRGHYGDAVAEMGAQGAFVYSSDHDLRNSMLAGFYAKKLGIAADYVPKADICDRMPDWWLSENSPAPLPEHFALARTTCTLRLERQHLYPVWGLSGGPLAVYRRVP